MFKKILAPRKNGSLRRGNGLQSGSEQQRRGVEIGGKNCYRHDHAGRAGEFFGDGSTNRVLAEQSYRDPQHRKHKEPRAISRHPYREGGKGGFHILREASRFEQHIHCEQAERNENKLGESDGKNHNVESRARRMTSSGAARLNQISKDNAP